MTATTTNTARFAAALIVALAIAAPPASAAGRMHWYHSQTSVSTAGLGSTVVVGLESTDDLASLRAEYGFDRVRPIAALHAAVVSVDPARLRGLLADPRLRYVSPLEPKRRALSVPNDPLLHSLDGRTNLPYEWQFAAAGGGRALDVSRGDPRVVVGVIDTGVDEVPDLAGKVDSRWSVNGTEVVRSEEGDDYGHGTAVASLIAANVDDGFGMAGFGGASHVIAVHAGTQGYFFDTQVALALTKLVSLGARIVNLSLGGKIPSEPILVDAIHLAAAHGVLLVAAAGNDGRNVGWPAADLQASGGGRGYGLAVGASNVAGERAQFSAWGKHLSLVAPGEYGGSCSGVLVALPPVNLFDDMCFLTWSGEGGARYGELAGTSFAAPEVAGVAALIWAARPELTNYQVADIIKQSARRDASDWTPEMGCGVLDAGAALELATSPAAAPHDDTVCTTSGGQPPAWPSEANQTISFAPLPNKTFGAPDFRVRATASSGLPVTFTAGGDCTVNAATVHLTGAGSCSITASQDGNARYNLAPSISRSFSIAEPATPRAHALAAPGRWGARVRLPFRTETGNRDVAARIVVQRNRTTVAGLAGGFFTAQSGHVYALTWRAPRAKTAGAFRFCVTLADRAGTTSAPDCGSIDLR
jgi:subtilisin family serine protease